MEENKPNVNNDQQQSKETEKKDKKAGRKDQPKRIILKGPSSFVEKQTALSSLVAAMGEKEYTKTISAKPFVVTHVQYNGKPVYDKYLDVDYFKQVVNQYWIENYGGQVPSAAMLDNYANAFKSYLSKSEEAFARMLQLTRTQNCFNLENEIVGKVGRMFNDPDDLNIAEIQARLRNSSYPKIVENVANGKLKSTTGAYLLGNLASNAVWTQKYVARLAHVYLPNHVISMLKLLFEGVIELSQDDDETLRYVCFWHPSNNPEPAGGNGQFPMLCDNSMEDFLTDYNTTINACQDLLSQYSSLKPILERMGWKCTRYAADWTRDLEGKTLPLIKDTTFNSLEYILNSTILAQADMLNDTDRLMNSIIVDRNDKREISDILRYPDRNIEISDLYNFENFIRAKISSLCANMIIITRNGGNTAYTSELRSYTADNYTVAQGTFAPAILELMNGLDTTTDTDALMGGPLHVLKLDGGIRGELDISILASDLEASARTYLIPESDIGQIIFCVNSAFFLDYSALKQEKTNTAK